MKSLLCLFLLVFLLLLGARKNEFEDLRLLTKAFKIVEDNYIEKVSFKKLVYGAVEGVLSALDPYSAFMEPKFYREFKKESGGKFLGLGLEIGVKKGRITVISPIKDSPAWKAGVLPGDEITFINSIDVKKLSLTQVIQELRRRSYVMLEIKRNSDQILRFKIKRKIIKTQPLDIYKIDKFYFIARITSFSKGVGEDFEKRISSLIERKKTKGIILDLRNNPGGYLSEAVRVADFFLEDGIIVSIRGRNHKEIISATSKSYKEVPVVILVNSYSASASEILAASLKENRRGVVVGEKTFGKASVQSLIDLSDGSAIKLTTALYYTPKGASIEGQGVRPNVIAVDKRDEKRKLLPYSQKNLQEHIKKDIPLKKSIELLKKAHL